MGKFVIKNPGVLINAIDLTDHSSKATVATTFNQVDVTTFGATYKEILQGLGDASITVDFFQDYASGSVDATLWPLSQSGSIFEVVIYSKGTTASSTQPSWTMQAILSDYNPFDGAIGDASATSVTFSNADQSGIVRGTA